MRCWLASTHCIFHDSKIFHAATEHVRTCYPLMMAFLGRLEIRGIEVLPCNDYESEERRRLIPHQRPLCWTHLIHRTLIACSIVASLRYPSACPGLFIASSPKYNPALHSLSQLPSRQRCLSATELTASGRMRPDLRRNEYSRHRLRDSSVTCLGTCRGTRCRSERRLSRAG